jgi:hypothetical protein
MPSVARRYSIVTNTAAPTAVTMNAIPAKACCACCACRGPPTYTVLEGAANVEFASPPPATCGAVVPSDSRNRDESGKRRSEASAYDASNPAVSTKSATVRRCADDVNHIIPRYYGQTEGTHPTGPLHKTCKYNETGSPIPYRRAMISMHSPLYNGLRAKGERRPRPSSLQSQKLCGLVFFLENGTECISFLYHQDEIRRGEHGLNVVQSVYPTRRRNSFRCSAVTKVASRSNRARVPEGSSSRALPLAMFWRMISIRSGS